MRKFTICTSSVMFRLMIPGCSSPLAPSEASDGKATRSAKPRNMAAITIKVVRSFIMAFDPPSPRLSLRAPAGRAAIRLLLFLARSVPVRQQRTHQKIATHADLNGQETQCQPDQIHRQVTNHQEKKNCCPQQPDERPDPPAPLAAPLGTWLLREAGNSGDDEPKAAEAHHPARRKTQH